MSSQTSRLRIALRILAIRISERSNFSEGETERDLGLMAFKSGFISPGEND